MACSKRPKFDHCTHAVSLPQSHSTGGSHRDLPSQGHPLALWLRCSPQSILLPAEKTFCGSGVPQQPGCLFQCLKIPVCQLLGESIPSLRSAFLPGNPDPQPRSLRAAERMDVLAGCIPPTSCPGFGKEQALFTKAEPVWGLELWSLQFGSSGVHSSINHTLTSCWRACFKSPQTALALLRVH